MKVTDQLRALLTPLRRDIDSEPFPDITAPPELVRAVASRLEDELGPRHGAARRRRP